MPRYSFLDDYSEGCHPQILEALGRTNLTQQAAYGEDVYSVEARRLIRDQLGNFNAGVYFVASGTLANIIAISSCLRPHEAVIAASSGHIAAREAGAIEATGHKVITVASSDGRLNPNDVQLALESNSHFPHMAKPRMVYVSNATEFGTVYNRVELEGLSRICRSNGLLLYVDGARLGAALSAARNDMSLKDISTLADIFWIGGTKVGALFGEAIVVCNAALNQDMSFHIKQRGGLLAKGRALGVQFLELFKDKLFFDAATHANRMAEELSIAIQNRGYDLAAATESNQIFPVFPDTLIRELKKSFDFYVWESHPDQRSTVRLVTSWATEQSSVNLFIEKLG